MKISDHKVFYSILIAGALIALVLIGIGIRGNAYSVFTPSELLDSDVKDGVRVRIAGRVADKEIRYSISPFPRLVFYISDPGVKGGDGDNLLIIEYRGVKPDMFKAGRDVIIDGAMKEGVFMADRLLTQCPSKYEPAVNVEHGYKSSE